MKKFIIWALVAIFVFTGAKIVLQKNKDAETTFIFGKIDRGDIQNSVTCTGTLSAISTVDVGTQVSGIIDQVFVDYNDLVHKNQLLARLDTTILSNSVFEAKINVSKTKALYDQAVYQFEQQERLYKQNLLSEYNYITSKTNKATTYASYESALVSLKRAQQNLDYAFIRSPIKGKILERNVEEGQTVASSLQTPTLFLIAEDLSKMTIHAQVDESDIGLIKEGMPVTFTVQTYSDKTFSGKVKQLWLQPETVQNVVNYTVVIDAENKDGFLLPGMTASIDFIIEQRTNVLRVPNNALKIKPTEEMMQTLFNKRKSHQGERPNLPKMGTTFQGAPMEAGQKPDGQPDFQKNRKAPTMIWIKTDDSLEPVPVKTGITDGKYTEIENNPRLADGSEILISHTSTSTSSNNDKFHGPGFMPPPGRM